MGRNTLTLFDNVTTSKMVVKMKDNKLDMFPVSVDRIKRLIFLY